jgi:site-specific DNA-methyltransferase (adenine-specific)
MVKIPFKSKETKFPSWWKSENPWIIADCIEIMRNLPDKCIDLILTDPPYGVDLDYGETYSDTQDALIDLISKFMPEILRISKRAIITCGMKNIHIYPRSDWVGIWYSSAGAGQGPWGFTCSHPILYYGKDPYLANGLGSRPDSIESNEHSIVNDHPCPKPDNVWDWLLLRGSCFENDIIFDPFLGSGTTLLSCKKNNRIGLGCELNPEYESIIKKRSGHLIKPIDGDDF